MRRFARCLGSTEVLWLGDNRIYHRASAGTFPAEPDF